MDAENIAKIHQDLAKILSIMLNLSKCITCEDRVVVVVVERVEQL